MQKFSILISGLLFGSGVTISGMVNPERVTNFFDITGTWDPTLLCVMAAALGVTMLGYAIIFKNPSPLFAEKFNLPPKTTIDLGLIIGASLFGMGWGLTGFCPGPALASLVFGYGESFIFVLAMFVGMLAYQLAASKLIK